MTTIPWKPLSGPEKKSTIAPCYIKDFKPTDVLMGRGTPSVLHPGNVFFRCLVDDCKNEYVRSKSNADKNILARQIVDAVASKGGRFLSRVEFRTKKAVDLGVPKEMKAAWVLAPDEVVLTKVKQCMRDLFKRSSQHVNQERHKPQSSGRITAIGSRIQAELSNPVSSSSKSPPKARFPFNFLPTMSQTTSTIEQAQILPSGAPMKDAAVWPLLQLHPQHTQQQQQEVSDRVRAILSQHASLEVNQTAAAQTLLSLNAGTKQRVGPSLVDMERSAGSAAHAPNSDVGCPVGGNNHQEAALLSALCRRQMELASNYSPARMYTEINHLQQSNPTELMQRQAEPRVSALHSPMLASEKALMALLLLLQEQNGRNSLPPVYASARPNHFNQVHRQSTQESGLTISRPPPQSDSFGSQLSSLLSQLINNNAHSVLSSQQTQAPSPVDLHPINTMMAEMLMNRLLGLSSSTETATIQGEDRKPRRLNDEK